MDFKYIKNISDGGEAVIILHGQIGDSYNDAGEITQYGINGSSFAYEMQYLQDKATSIRVSINSIGGAVIDGYSIMSAILDSKVRVITSIDGLAASIAGVIAMTGDRVEMKDFGTLMMHNPSGGSDKEVLALMKESLVTVIKNRTTLESETVSKMMDSETWMNAEQAMEAGMIDKIISSGRKVSREGVKNLNDLVLIYNKINQKPNTMDLINNKLGLDSAASEKEGVTAIEELQNKNLELKDELKAATDKAEALENTAKELEDKRVKEEEEAKLTAATEMVNSFKDVKDKEATIKLALNDFESVKNLLEMGAKGKSVKITNAITPTGKEAKAGAVVNVERADWSLRDWEKKDEKGLKAIQNNSPEIYSEMYKEQYGVEYKA